MEVASEAEVEDIGEDGEVEIKDPGDEGGGIVLPVDVVSEEEQEDADMMGFQSRADVMTVPRQIGRGRNDDPRRDSKVPTLQVPYDVYMDVWLFCSAVGPHAF